MNRLLLVLIFSFIIQTFAQNYVPNNNPQNQMPQIQFRISPQSNLNEQSLFRPQMNSMGQFNGNPAQNSFLLNSNSQNSFNAPPRTTFAQDRSNNPSTFQGVKSASSVPKFCPFKGTITCNPNFPYRTFDGSCNNLRNLWWGKTDTPYKRILIPAYADQISEPRASIDGSELPNARDLACSLHSESHEIEAFVNNAFMQWGQFINHDITSLSNTRDEEQNISICNSCTKTEKCLPIMINKNMRCNCIPQMTHPCIEFTRSSASFSDIGCSTEQREQLNLQTPYIDGSMIYGVEAEENEKLRDKTRGRGRMLVQQNDLLPQDKTEEPSDCLDFADHQRCFKAGDDRVNQNSGLMTFHTIFVREHNRIADILSQLNPSWSDEIVFQETRRVIVAIIQHINYNEYVPVLLGQNFAAQLGLLPGRGTEQTNFYDPNLDPRVSNEYAAAYGRFGHSMIRGTYSRVNNKYESAGSTPFMLRHSYFRANHIYDECQGGLESIVRGMLKDPVMKVDRWFTDDISKHLFEVTDNFSRPFHFDLVSINIQRGRDHGVPGYLKFREFCGLPPIRSWEEMKLYISDDVVDIFRSFYKFVEDVDLFSASVSEFKQEGSLVGPILTCLLGSHFRDLKFGDRFWYETNQFPAAFTPFQLAEIRKMSLSKILCNNLKNSLEIQPKALLSSKLRDNSLISCSSLTDINWNLWRA